MKVYFRALDSELPSFEAELDAVPRAGEEVETAEGEAYTVRRVSWLVSALGKVDPYVFID